MMCSGKRAKKQQTAEYATAEDFCRIFAESMNDLYQLAYLLTGDHQKAEKCYVAGLEDSVNSNRVFKDWAHSWAKRTIVQNAIRELKPHASTVRSSVFPAPPYVDGLAVEEGGHLAVRAMLALEDFDRFVFVMSLLERYSEHECSLLLACAPRQIREARSRVLAQLVDTPKIGFPTQLNFEKVSELVR
jgi:DNA-directed RNA polymerase specialized sigma24 family protein